MNLLGFDAGKGNICENDVCRWGSWWFVNMSKMWTISNITINGLEMVLAPIGRLMALDLPHCSKQVFYLDSDTVQEFQPYCWIVPL